MNYCGIIQFSPNRGNTHYRISEALRVCWSQVEVAAGNAGEYISTPFFRTLLFIT
jgi:hypothetical protein